MKTKMTLSSSRQTILVVDDSGDYRLLIGAVFKSRGYAVVEASDGKEALNYLISHPTPGAILLDLQMPKMNGFEFRRAQVSDDRFRDIPVVLYSNDADLADVAENLHVSGYVSKFAPTNAVVGEVTRCLASVF